MTRPVEVLVTGHPVAKGRGRVGKLANGRATVFTPTKTRKWEADARQVAREAMAGREPLAGPLACRVVATFVPPASWPAWKREAALCGQVHHTGKPDGDNVLKAAKDALNGVVWVDDAQVVEVAVTKGYSDAPGVRIQVFPMAGAPSQITRKADLLAKTGGSDEQGNG